MAFEKINEYTERLKVDYLKAHSREVTADRNGDRSKSAMAYHTKNVILNCLVAYYETALQTGKFASQRKHLKEVITQLEPTFAKGYFAPIKKSKPGTGN